MYTSMMSLLMQSLERLSMVRIAQKPNRAQIRGDGCSKIRIGDSTGSLRAAESPESALFYQGFMLGSRRAASDDGTRAGLVQNHTIKTLWLRSVALAFRAPTPHEVQSPTFEGYQANSSLFSIAV